MSRLLDRESIEILQVAIPSGFSYLHLLFNTLAFLPDHCITIVNHTGSIDRTVRIHEATAYFTQSNSLDSRLGCTESERGSKLDRAKEYFHTTDHQNFTGPHALRLCVLHCTVQGVLISP